VKVLVCFLLILVSSCKSPLEKSELTVINDRCTSCKTCVYSCQSDAITIINGVAVIDPAKCTQCGKCVEVCPTNAIY